jgi:acyl-coenzyme A synthetase/AMP-(fatty) acid ligase
MSHSGFWAGSSGDVLSHEHAQAIAKTLQSRVEGRAGEPVLAASQKATRLVPLALASWLNHRPFAVGPPDRDPAVCAGLIKATTLLRDEDSDAGMDSATSGPGADGCPLWASDECAAIIFSSGSTGVPKGVRHSLQSLTGSARLFLEHFEIGAHEQIMCLAAPHVMSGFRALLLPLMADISVTFLHDAPESGLKLVLRAMEGDLVICGPRFVQLTAACIPWLLDLPRRPRALLVTGDQLDEVCRRKVMDTLDLPVAAYYGLTETGGIVMAEKPGQPQDGMLPPACAGVAVHTRAVPGALDKVELGIEGPNNFIGYTGRPVQSHPVVWTGDLVVPSGGSGYRLAGRLDNAIKAADTTWLFPDRLEKWLREQDSVADAVVRPASQPAGLECWIDWEGVEDALVARIEADLGRNYRPRVIHRVTIIRSELGKLRSITPREPAGSISMPIAS